MSRTLLPVLSLVAALGAAPVAWSAGPAPAAAPSPSAAPAVTGQVLEVQQSGPYTYLRIKTPKGETWAAVQSVNVAKGAQVTIANPIVMEKFESKALKRTFDSIVFGMLQEPGGAAAGPAAKGAPRPQGGGMAGAMAAGTGGPGGAGIQAGHAGMPSAVPSAAPAPVKVTKAEGPDGRTVAEVYATKGKLKDKAVVVRGQVVKVSLGIMGKNWVHLRDGSGAEADGSNDLLVTTQDKAAVGDVVVARGTVRTEVNLGSGYNYAVLVEGAALKK